MSQILAQGVKSAKHLLAPGKERALRTMAPGILPEIERGFVREFYRSLFMFDHSVTIAP
jgi:hypothetical protein